MGLAQAGYGPQILLVGLHSIKLNPRDSKCNQRNVTATNSEIWLPAAGKSNRSDKCSLSRNLKLRIQSFQGGCRKSPSY